MQPPATPTTQLLIFLLLIGMVLVFIKMNSYERRIKQLEDNLNKYVTYEDYMETFRNMFHDMMEKNDDDDL